ncbi:MHYT domain-containing protein, partial [Streptomyces montanisoli]
MQGTVNGFSYGLVTPVAAFLAASLGGALGLRCVAPALRGRGRRRPAALVLGTLTLGCGVWTSHTVAMTGFAVDGTSVGYDTVTMFASLVVGLLMIGAGLFVVGQRGASRMGLVSGGTLTGLGIASTHYLGMAGMELDGMVEYSTPTVVGAVAVGVAASVAALYTTSRYRRVPGALAAAGCLGLATTAMHYIAMAGATIDLTSPVATGGGGPDPGDLLPMLAGPAAFLVLAAAVALGRPRLLPGAAPHRATAPEAVR